MHDCLIEERPHYRTGVTSWTSGELSVNGGLAMASVGACGVVRIYMRVSRKIFPDLIMNISSCCCLMRRIRCSGFTPSRFVFFFQAEDGIRDIGVTGVQTCA